MLYHFQGEGLDKKKIMEEFKKKRYNFAKVARVFKLIEEDTKTIFINREEDAKKLLNEIKYKGYTKSGMRRAGQYCIQVYEEEFSKLADAGMLKVVSEDVKDFYELVNTGQYTKEMGLNIKVDSGMSIFM